MATYQELFELSAGESQVRNKIAVACIVAADAILNDAAPPANQPAREKWAVKAFQNPLGVAQEMLMALLAANKDATVAQIQGASDAAIQTKVDAAVNLFADNLPV